MEANSLADAASSRMLSLGRPQRVGIIVIQVDFRLGPNIQRQLKSKTAPQPTNGSVPYELGFLIPFLVTEDNQAGSATATLQDSAATQIDPSGSGPRWGGEAAVAVTLKLHGGNVDSIVKGVVAKCPAVMHPFNVPEEYRPMYKACE